MRLSDLTRGAERSFPFVVCAGVAAAAYFQARGLASLVAATWIVPPPLVTATPAPPTEKLPDARPILARNPFQSKEQELEAAAPSAAVTQVSAPELQLAPQCTFGALAMTLQRSDPTESLAVILDVQGSSRLAGIDDVVGEHQLRRVAWDRVWFRKGDDRCQMKMGDQSYVRPKKRAVPRPSKAPKRAPRRKLGVLPKHIADKIERAGPNEFNVDRAVVDEILEQQAELFRRTRVRPIIRNGSVLGMQIQRLVGGSLLDTLGLQNGDILQSINGFELSDPAKALQAYGRLRSADRLTLALEREGRPATIDINIR